jgi:hypothetical protein
MPTFGEGARLFWNHWSANKYYVRSVIQVNGRASTIYARRFDRRVQMYGNYIHDYPERY